MKKYFLTWALVLSFFLLHAQYYYDRSKSPEKVVATQKTGRDFDSYYFFSWDMNKPLSNTSYIDQQSLLGTRFGFRKRLNEEDRLWVGGELSWVVYKQYFPYTTYQGSNGAFSTDVYNYSYNYSLTANIDYMFRPTDKILVPYGGLGIGLAYDKFADYYNIYGDSKDTWGLMLRPEIGVLVGFGENSAWRAKLAAHFDYATNKDTSFGYNNFMNAGFQIGIVKMAW